MRAAIYARYSSELQREASIEDQHRICRRLIDERGWSEAKLYADQGLSGSSHLRPAYQAMMMDARKGLFDVLVAEGIDRLSRDQNPSPPSTSSCVISASRSSPWPRARFPSCISA